MNNAIQFRITSDEATRVRKSKGVSRREISPTVVNQNSDAVAGQEISIESVFVLDASM
jgi:hypothetical protein